MCCARFYNSQLCQSFFIVVFWKKIMYNFPEVIAMKVGIIRCMQTEDYCPGTTDFKVIREKSGAFADIQEDIEIVGFINCGGCPAKKAVLRHES